MLPMIKAAGINQLHFGGGGVADQYDWATGQEINDCPDQAPPSFQLPCGNKVDSLSFDQLSPIAQSIGAQLYATVNYGSGKPAWAADWVAHSVAADEPVAQWSIGNESYGCWSPDWWLTQPPLADTAYKPNVYEVCPWTTATSQGAGVTEMAQSYAENALPYMQQMTAADAGIKIGFPWAFDGSVKGAGVPNWQSWDDTILKADGQYISFVEAHWYPFGATVPDTGTVLQSVKSIPNLYNEMRGVINADDPKATITIGETGVSYLATKVPCIAAGAPFAAADALEWLAAGAATVDWWPVDTGANTGSACTAPEEAMFTGNGTPDSVYYGYVLASQLAQPNARLSALTSSNRNVVAFQSALPDGQTAVELVNLNPSSSERVTVNASVSGPLSMQSLNPSNPNAIDRNIVTGSTSATALAGGITLAPESIVVLKSHLPTQLTLGAAGNTLKPGAKVTLSGKLTLNGAAAPANTTVKVYRRLSGSRVGQPTLTTTTTTAGAFTVTDTPPGRGNYSYTAVYAGTSLLAPAVTAYAVHVLALKPALKVAVSATTVRPGRTVRVTATLGPTHANRTLIIYAQIKGGGRKMLKRATVNARGQLSVVYPMRVNTTFTVAFPGDAWYSPATATVLVKA